MRPRVDEVVSGKEAAHMRSGNLSDEQWRLVEGLLSRPKYVGKWNDHHLTFDGIMRDPVEDRAPTPDVAIAPWEKLWQDGVGT
jgi:hypothetical protein